MAEHSNQATSQETDVEHKRRKFIGFPKMAIAKLLRRLSYVVGVALAVVVILFFVQRFNQPRYVRNLLVSVRSVSRLETTVMNIQGEEVTVRREGLRWQNIEGMPAIFPDWVDTDTLTLTAGGEVIAGLDLSELSEDAVQVNGTTVTISLPPAQILTWKLDSRSTSVKARRRGIFRPIPNIALEGEARQLAEYGILNSACEAEILTRATTDAVKAVEEVLENIEGIPDVTFNIQVAPPARQRCDSVSRFLMEAS